MPVADAWIAGGDTSTVYYSYSSPISTHWTKVVDIIQATIGYPVCPVQRAVSQFDTLYLGLRPSLDTERMDSWMDNWSLER